MPVISGYRAEPLDLVQLAPRSVPHDAMRIGAGNLIIHDIQRRVSVDQDVVRIVFHHIPDQNLRLADAAKHTIIAAVRSVLTGKVRR